MDGFFNVNKEKGYTSFDVCNYIKHKFKEKKVGHSGTLDPNATGVMQVAVGKATKLLPLLEDHNKTYIATVRFGILTDTLDPEGNVLETNIPTNLDLSIIKEKVKELSKKTKQIPPIYSAIKVNGKKLYEYARNNIDIEIKERPCKVFYSEIVTDLYDEDGYPTIRIMLEVSKGFYVRSFVRDLGEALGTIAIMQDLVRTKTGVFEIKDSYLINEVSEDSLIPIDALFSSSPIFYANDYLAKLIKNGVELDERQMKVKEPFRVYYNDKLIAIYAPSNHNKYKIVQYFGD